MAEVSIVSTWNSTAGTAATPTSLSGDSQVLSVYRDGSTSAPTITAGAGWTDFGTVSGNSNSARVASRTVSSSNQTTSTTVNQTNKIGVTLRDVLSFGTWVNGGTAASSNTIALPAVTIPTLNANEGCKILYGCAHRTATNVGITPPSGLTFVVSVSDKHALFITTDYVTSNRSSINYSVNATDRWMSWAVPIVGRRGTADFFQMF